MRSAGPAPARGVGVPETDFLTWLPQSGAVGLLSVTVLLILLGRIVPRVTHNEVRKDRDDYRKAAEKALAGASEMSSHVGQLTTAVGQLTTAVQQQAETQRETLSLVRQLMRDLASDGHVS